MAAGSKRSSAKAKRPSKLTTPKQPPGKAAKRPPGKVTAKTAKPASRKTAKRPSKKAAATVKRPADKTLASRTAKLPARKKPAGAKAKPKPRSAPVPSPSERVLAAYADPPTERDLTDEETTAMAKVADSARRLIDASGSPEEIVGGIAAYLDDVRNGRRDEPKSHDLRLGLGVLWGEQLRAQVGWRWVHLSYSDGFASYALVPDDRAFACFPLNRVPDALRSVGTNTSAHVFASIKSGALPTRKASSYLVIG